MILLKYLAGLAAALGIVFAGTYGVSQEMALGGPSDGGNIGVYNASPVTLRDGYGSALATDVNGKLLLSPLSSVGGGLSGGSAGKVALWQSASTAGYDTNFTYATSASSHSVLSVVGGAVSSTYATATFGYYNSYLGIGQATSSVGLSGATPYVFKAVGSAGIGDMSDGSGLYLKVAQEYRPALVVRHLSFGDQNFSKISFEGSGGTQGLQFKSSGRSFLFDGGTYNEGSPDYPDYLIGTALYVKGTWQNIVSMNRSDGIVLNITDTSSTVDSLLLNLRVNDVAKFTVRKDGHVSMLSASTSALNLSSTNTNITVNGENSREPVPLTACGGMGNVTNGAGGPNQVEMATNMQNTCALHFSPSSLNKATWSFVMPNNWDGGSVTATFAYFTTSTDTGGATFGVRGYTVNPGNSLDGTWGATSTVTFGTNGTSMTGTYSSSVTMTLGGTPVGGRKVFIEVSRDGAAAADTGTAWAALTDVYIQYGKKAYSDL